eukprot:Skav211281  [mRNA]  locus=scaffold2429:121314:122940:+ [translate_table: standard]
MIEGKRGEDSETESEEPEEEQEEDSETESAEESQNESDEESAEGEESDETTQKGYLLRSKSESKQLFTSRQHACCAVAMLVKIERDVLQTQNSTNRVAAALAGLQQVSQMQRMQVEQFIRERETLRQLVGISKSNTLAIESG